MEKSLKSECYLTHRYLKAKNYLDVKRQVIKKKFHYIVLNKMSIVIMGERNASAGR